MARDSEPVHGAALARASPPDALFAPQVRLSGPVDAAKFAAFQDQFRAVQGGPDRWWWN